jgi:hypothetical protein
VPHLRRQRHPESWHARVGREGLMAVYDPTTPAIAQNDPYSCSATAARWAMTAYGRHPTEQWFESTMLADGIMSTDLGLLDASGAGLAAWLTEQYGEFGFVAHSNGRVSFDDAKSVAGQAPVLIGGRAWGHWSGVRGYDPSTDTLQLANPADGWMGVGQSMSRQQFDALGSFSMVVVTWQDPSPPAPVVEPPAPTVSTFDVGSGILNAMTNVGEIPASSEVHFGPEGLGWAQAYSTQGRCFTWIDSLGIVVTTEGWQGVMV